MTRLGALARSATLAGVVLGCSAPATEPAGDATILVPPALGAPPASGSASGPSAKPHDRFQELAFAALEGICERAWWGEGDDLRAGCKECPATPRSPQGGRTEPKPAAIAHADPALRVLRRYAARLMGNAAPEIVLSYEGCRPESDNVGTLVIDAEKKVLLRDHPSFELLACETAARDKREVLVCIGHENAWTQREGLKERTVGVYDGLKQRWLSNGRPTEVITWHPRRLFVSDADYFCGQTHGTPPRLDIRFGRVTGISVSAGLFTFTGTFAKHAPSDAFRKACEDGADLGAVLQPAPFSLDFELREGKLVATPSAESWLAATR